MRFRLVFETAIHEELVAELEKGAVYAAEPLRSLRVSEDRLAADIECAEGREREVTESVRRYAAAMVKGFRSFGSPQEIARTPRTDEGPLERGVLAELRRRRWVYELGRGQVGFAGGAFALMRFLDEVVRDVALSRFGAREEGYPALLGSDVLARCGYFSSFPQSVSLVTHLREDFDGIEAFRSANTDQDTLIVPQSGMLAGPDAVLRPAVCLPCYLSLQDTTVPARGLTLTSTGKVFRYESKNLGGLHRLWDFTMREIIFVGSEAFVRERKGPIVQAVIDLLTAWDLEASLASATDPFFATVRSAKVLWQRSGDLKQEMLVPMDTEHGTEIAAAGSINLAGTLFGHVFRIKTDEDEVASTACVGFGMERLVLALFTQHGFQPHRWPVGMRQVVFG